MKRLSCEFLTPLCAAALAATLSACGAAGRASTPAPADARAGRGDAGPIIPVAAQAVERKPISNVIQAVGTAEPYSTVAVRAQTTGELTSVNFRDGDEVQAGQLLFTLDRRPLEAALQQAQANLDRDLAQSNNAKAQLKRYQDLAERGIATGEQLDQIRTTVSALDATVAADRAAVQNAQVQLAYATIAAPLSGRTGKLMINVGNLIRANDATPLVIINQISPIYVSFGIPEAQLGELKRHMARGELPVDATAPGSSERKATGRLSFVDNTIDQTTGTIGVRATFPNEGRTLWPGEFVNVSVTLDTNPSAIVVPTKAVQDSQQGKFVFVVSPEKTVDRRSIRVAQAVGTETVIADGLKPGELVVTDGQIRLAPGFHVTLRTDAP